jgi:hypothetical protein
MEEEFKLASAHVTVKLMGPLFVKVELGEPIVTVGGVVSATFTEMVRDAVAIPSLTWTLKLSDPV